MKRSFYQPLVPGLLLPFLALAAGAQATVGTSHPEQLTDSIVQTDQTDQADHYVKPSERAAAQAVAPPAYQNSFPATGAPAAEPRLITRQPAPTVDAAPASMQAEDASAGAMPAAPPAVDPRDTHDGDIVLEVPTRPHELNRGTLLHARLRETLSTQSTREGSVFTAELLQDAGHHGEVLLPAGSLIRGHVTGVHGGKRIGGRAALHLQPETVSLPDGTLYRLDAQITDLDGTESVRVTDEGTVVLRSHPKATVAVMGGVTLTAAVTGAVIGGGVGAAVGAIAGAGVATAWWLKRDVQETLPRGTTLIFALDQPLVVAPH